MRPTGIKIFGQKYVIKYDYKVEEDYGMTDSAINTIYLRGTLPEDKLKRVFMHELTHAVIHETPLCDRRRFDVEEVCDIVGFHILDALKDNPKVFEWVFADEV
jgi:Zn-dependent peptidase ImmA (M78 family)